MAPLDATPNAAPAVENHFLRRARNHEIRRSRRTRTLLAASIVWSARALVLGALAAGATHAWRAVETSQRYALRKIQMAGVQGPMRQELGERLARFHGANLFRLSLHE